MITIYREGVASLENKNCIRQYINNKFIKNNPIISGEMQYYNNIYGRPERTVDRAILAGKLFLRHVVFKNSFLYISKIQQRKIHYPESSSALQVSGSLIRKRIKSADIIIFDIWNVLIYFALDFRQMQFWMEAVAEYPGFSECEDIFTALDDERLQYLEGVYIDFCLDNMYMHYILDYARQAGKRVYVYNNSNYDQGFVRKILNTFNYDCEFSEDRPSNALYITESPSGKTDIKYINVNVLGKHYRPFYHLNIITAFYNQVINLRFHSGIKKESIFYEYGFTCGGILACGFCQYMNVIAKSEQIDKFVFVSRDGYIFKQIYDQYYKKNDTSYLHFSRSASYEIIFDDFPEEYINKTIKIKMLDSNGKKTIKTILKECNIGFAERYLEKEGLLLDEPLNDKSFPLLKKILLQNKTKIAERFLISSKAAKKYFLKELDGFKKVCVVDLGWKGTSIIYLKHLMEKKYGWTGNIIGVMVGASSDGVTQNYIRTHVINAYAFDSDFYRRTGIKNGEYMSAEETACIEMLFTAEERTLLRYGLDKNGNINFIYKDDNPNKNIIKEIHRGIRDFVKVYAPIINKYHLYITARDAYTPLDFFMQNSQFRKLILKPYKMEL